MGFPCIGFKVAKLVTVLLDLVAYVKFMVMVALFHLGLLGPSDQPYSWGHDANSVISGSTTTPSSASVPVVPWAIMSPTVLETIKKRLPVVEFGDFVQRSGVGIDCEPVCAVCLSCLERFDEIRELSNCFHVFHKECLDKWVDESQVTCPLCRSKLLPSQAEEMRGGGGDPWMVERIAYVFGEDW